MTLKDCFTRADRQLLKDAVLERHGTPEFMVAAQEQLLENLLNNISTTEPVDCDLLLTCFHIWLPEEGPRMDLRFYDKKAILQTFRAIFPYEHMTAILDDPNPRLVRPLELDRIGVCTYLDYRPLLPKSIPWDSLLLEEALGAKVFSHCDALVPETLLRQWLERSPSVSIPPESSGYREPEARMALYNAVSEYHALRKTWSQISKRPLPQEPSFSATLRTSQDGQFTYYYFGNGRILLEDYLGTRRVLELPQTLDGHRVLPVIHDGAFSGCQTVEVLVVRQPNVAFGINTFWNCTIKKAIGIRCPGEEDPRIDPSYLRFYGTFDEKWDHEELTWPLPENARPYQYANRLDLLLEHLARDDAEAAIRHINSWYHLPF